MLIVFVPALLLVVVNLVAERVIRRRVLLGRLVVPWIALTVVALAGSLVYLRIYRQHAHWLPWLQWGALAGTVIAIGLELARVRMALRARPIS